MSLPQNLTDDLAILDQDQLDDAAKAQALGVATQNRIQAEATEQAAMVDKGKAADAKAAQLAKVKADLDAIYGPVAPAPAA